MPIHDRGSHISTTPCPQIDRVEIHRNSAHAPRPKLFSPSTRPLFRPTRLRAERNAPAILTPPSATSVHPRRPVRPRPAMSTCAPPSIAISTSSAGFGPVREMQAFTGPRPANSESNLYRRNLARDIRRGPQLYNWLVSGVAHGALPPAPPPDDGELDNSDARPEPHR